jgi:hypothetical protein
MMFANVPSPGICFNGIQSASTIKEIKKVASPILSGVFKDMPWASTDHGAFPSPVIISSESPIPNMNNPKIRINIL